MIRHLLFLFILLITCGCASTPQYDATNQTQSKPNEAVINVWYATDRNPTGKENAGEYFGVERGELSFGICQVGIDLNERITPFADNMFLQFNTDKDLSAPSELRAIHVIPKSEFFAQMQQRLNSSN